MRLGNRALTVIAGASGNGAGATVITGSHRPGRAEWQQDAGNSSSSAASVASPSGIGERDCSRINNCGSPGLRAETDHLGVPGRR